MFTVYRPKGVFWILGMLFFAFYAGNLPEEDSQKDYEHLLIGQQTMEGTVSEVRDGMVYVKIESGVREFSLNAAKKEGVKSPNAGDRVQLTINQGNEIIEIEKIPVEKDEPSKETHPMVTGQMTRFDSDNKEIVLKLKSGKSKQYKLKDAAATKMGEISPGTSIIMEIDPKNGMGMDFEIHS